MASKITYEKMDNHPYKEHIKVYYYGKRVGSLNKLNGEVDWEFLSYPNSEFYARHRSLVQIKKSIRTYCILYREKGEPTLCAD